MSNSDNIYKLPIIPKTTKQLYKRIPITVTFNPSTKKWSWEITVTTVTKYSEVSDTELKAIKAAQKYIDRQGLGD